MGDSATSEWTGSDGARAITLRIPAKPEYIALCRLALTGLSQLRAIGDDTMADLKLALTEAVSNSVRHAYGPSGEGHVDVTYELAADRLGIQVVDDGEGFDPDEPPSVRRRGALRGRTRHRDHPLDRRRVRDSVGTGRRGSRLRFAKRL